MYILNVVREKLAPEYLEGEVQYSPQQWDQFHALRAIACPVMEALQKYSPILHGSIARGDVSEKSDIDIILPYEIKEFQITFALQQLGYEPLERWLVQATPLSAIKGNILFSSDPELSITFPLIPFYPREYEFYYFGGAIRSKDLDENPVKRVPGVDKRLLFIQPTDKGHLEYRITSESAGSIAKVLNISIDTILERIRVLRRRDHVGRTGIFKKRLLTPTESFGGVLKQIAETNPASRRRIKRKKLV